MSFLDICPLFDPDPDALMELLLRLPPI